ncbi:hypothetical protein TcWFU_003966 [Taenia crassiceps]|uniref:DUF5734 domain-containing protein n=1 Tax=Taenia crassiceps TaxID=6207 RepID=A0ABR4QQG9_9CEST
MTEYNLDHFHVGKYKKEAKLNAQMTKELQKAVKAKPKGTKAKIQQNKVVFKNSKEEIIRADIAKVQRNKEKKIIVIASKLDKKKAAEIYALKFSDEKEFNEFFETIKEEKTPKEEEKCEVSKAPKELKNHEPAATAPTPKPAYSESRTTTPSPDFSEMKRTSPSLSSSISYARTPSPTSTSYTSPRSGYPRAPQTANRNKNYSRSSLSQSSSTLMRPSSVGAATYVTTDALPSRTRSRISVRGGRVSAKDVYPMKERSVKARGKSHTEPTFLTYVPNKGMVESMEGNVYLYAKTNANASTAASPFASSTSSSSTLATDPARKAQLFRLIRVSRSSSTSSRSSSSSSSSSSRSRKSRNTSPSSSTIRVKRVNVWKYRNRNAPSAMDDGIGGGRSRPQSAEYVRCPTCHHRSRSLARKP